MTTRARQDGGHEVHRVFSSGSASVSTARRWVGARLTDAGPDLQATVGLLVSELAANAVQHGGTAFTVRVDRSEEDRIRVEVTDEGGGSPQLQDQDPRAPSGRGLRLVDALAVAWGVRDDPSPSTTVWFTVLARP